MSQMETDPQVLADPDVAFVLAYLKENEAACPACGYNLHAVTRARCPECGRELMLHVTSPSELSHAWLIAIAAVGAGAGVGLWMLIAQWHQSWFYRGYLSELEGGLWKALFWLSSAMVPLALLLFSSVRVYVRRPLLLQWIVALFCIVCADAVLLMLAAAFCLRDL